VFSVYSTLCVSHRAGVTCCVFSVCHLVYASLGRCNMLCFQCISSCVITVCVSATCVAVYSPLWHHSACITDLCRSVVCCCTCNSVSKVTGPTIVGDLTPHNSTLFGNSRAQQSMPGQMSGLVFWGVGINGELRQGLLRRSFGKFDGNW
jgi:hypothetical protein